MKHVALARLFFSGAGLGAVGIFFAVSVHAATTNYLVRGVVKQIDLADHQLVIAHESVPNFMEAMTMPFNVKDGAIPDGLAVGATIRFEFHVNDTESWIDGIKQIAAAPSERNHTNIMVNPGAITASNSSTAVSEGDRTLLRNFKFTNELGQPVSFSDFRGQAVALTFFFTRCPVPDFCPRLSRNFQEAESKLGAMENAPTNWHLISVSFDPGRDTPDVLKAYAQTYHYQPEHWSFLTGPSDRISQLARVCGVQVEQNNGLFNHNFRTIIIDASNHLQMVFPTSGDLSDSIVQELLKATHPTNQVLKSETAANGAGSKN
jgi:protein SCO1/2